MKTLQRIKSPVLPLFVVFLVLLTLLAGAERLSPAAEEDLFFSMRRIVLRPEIALRLASRSESRAQKDISEFAAYYVAGIGNYYGGEPILASENFIKARQKWPEYFYADFAAALSYEAAGDHNEAARYYKSYLNKLKAYGRGHYGISSPIIRSFSTGSIEEYDYAYGAVKTRMSSYGISLGSVRPAVSSGILLFGAAGILGLFPLLYLVFYAVVPFAKKKIREKNPPEGFWICHGCGECVPELSFECSVCGRERPGKRFEGSGGGEDDKK